MRLHHPRIPAILLAMAASALALGGCSRQAEPSSDQATTEQPAQPEPAPEPAVVAETPPPPTENMARAHDVEAPAAPPVSREAQMQDDAAASGMTARLPRDDDSSPDASDSTRNDAY